MTPAEETVNGMNLRDFGQLPIVDRGRVKPIDAMARTDLTIISGKQTYLRRQRKEHSAVEWLLDVLTSRPPFKNPAATNNKVFRIENLQVLSLLDLKPDPGSYRYSIDEMRTNGRNSKRAPPRRREERTGHVRSQTYGIGRTSGAVYRIGEPGFAAAARSGRPESQARSLGDVVTEWSAKREAQKDKGADVDDIGRYDAAVFEAAFGLSIRNRGSRPKAFRHSQLLLPHLTSTKASPRTRNRAAGGDAKGRL